MYRVISQIFKLNKNLKLQINFLNSVYIMKYKLIELMDRGQKCIFICPRIYII